MIFERVLNYLRLARFNSPAGAFLLLWPTLWGLWISAKGYPGEELILFFTVGVFVTRAFGCVINDIIDQNLDGAVLRTKERPLAAGKVTLYEAIGVGLFFLSIALVLWFQLPWVARVFALFAFLITLLYPFCKRVIRLPQAVLGIAFGFGLPITYATLHNSFPPASIWLFFSANLLWVIAYDTIYAMADRDDDLAFGRVFSSAIWFGQKDVLIVSWLYIATVLWLSLIGFLLNFTLSYQVALIAAMVAVIRFWKFYKTRHPIACMSAFRANHWFGLFILAGIIGGQPSI